MSIRTLRKTKTEDSKLVPEADLENKNLPVPANALADAKPKD